MVSFFKDKSTASVFGIVFFSIVTRSSFLTDKPAVYSNPKEGAIHYLLTPLQNTGSILLIILFHSLVVVQALRLNYALNDSRMMPRPTFTTALAYVLLTALVPQWNSINGALIVNSFLIAILFLVIKLSASHHPLRLIYNIGFLCGLSGILYFPSIPIVIAIYFALAFVRPFHFNEWIIMLTGLLTPLYLLAGSLYLAGNLNLLTESIPEIIPHLIQPNEILMTVITFSFAALPVLLGIVYWQQNSAKMVIQVRSEWKFVFSLLVVLIPVVFILPGLWPIALLLAIVPASAFVSNAFYYPSSSVLPAIIFWGLMALIIYNNWVIAKL